MSNRYVLNPTEGKIMGVAAGLADYTGWDPLLIRLGFIATLFITGPIAILFYILTGWLAPNKG